MRALHAGLLALGGHDAAGRRVLWLTVAAVFVAAVAALVAGYRRLARKVELERAERILAEDWDERAGRRPTAP
jgi:hypothetical protein